MSISRGRLDRFISQHCQINRRNVRLMIAQKRIQVDELVAISVDQQVDKFSKIILDEKVIQDNSALYLMLHKPSGVVSATIDKEHKTVIDLISHELINKEQAKSLHIVGRLDLNTSGLILLTNDSRWSERLTHPEKKVAKRYRVTLGNQVMIDQQQTYIDAFERGMYFAFENLTTKPAQLLFLSGNVAELTLTEGRYHQIKRMFGRFQNPVIALHRYSIGSLGLTDDLAVGESRLLTMEQVEGI